MNKKMKYLSDKKIIVTGGTGFLGKHVINTLLEKGIDQNQIFVPRSKDYDLLNTEATHQLFSEQTPDVVIHLAARLGGIGDTRTHPASYFRENILIGMNVFDASLKSGVDKLINIGTVCSYPKVLSAPFKEEDLWNGYPEETNAPYGIAKKSLMAYAQAVEEQYGFNSVNLLLTNLYGPGDDFRDQTSHVIPAIIRKIYKAKQNKQSSIEAWGDGSPSRDFVYVKDAAEAIVLAAEHHNSCEPINIGSGIEITIKDLIEKIIGVIGFDGGIVWDTTKPNGQPRRLLDISRARESFGFDPTTSFDMGLRETIDWYLEKKDSIDEMPPKFEKELIQK
jgi:GDP-L-fucose synthase